jgi:hypothetical protein
VKDQKGIKDQKGMERQNSLKDMEGLKDQSGLDGQECLGSLHEDKDLESVLLSIRCLRRFAFYSRAHSKLRP